MLGSYSLSLWLISSGVLSTIDPRRARQVIGDIAEGKKQWVSCSLILSYFSMVSRYQE
jgi:hypothetical protein